MNCLTSKLILQHWKLTLLGSILNLKGSTQRLFRSRLSGFGLSFSTMDTKVNQICIKECLFCSTLSCFAIPFRQIGIKIIHLDIKESPVGSNLSGFVIPSIQLFINEYLFCPSLSDFGSTQRLGDSNLSLKRSTESPGGSTMKQKGSGLSVRRSLLWIIPSPFSTFY